jgi:RNA polymerase sigma-70 factor (ECF subfamily)
MTDVGAEHDALRPLMFSIAYRMLGSVAEAEDVVQEAFLRLLQSHRAGTVARSPEALATTVTTRLAIDELRSARRRRVEYVGPWLPEPLLADDAEPARRLETDESVSAAFLLLLERLTPQERAAFVLRESAAHDYGRIAEVLGTTEANARQLVHRARTRLAEGRPRFAVDAGRHADLTRRFLAAVRAGDVAELERLLAPDAELVADGGGRAPAVTAPVRGAGRIARFLARLVTLGERIGVRYRDVEANGEPALEVLGPGGEVLAVLGADVDGDRVGRVRNVMNPAKLAHLGPTGDVAALLRRAAGAP